MATLEDMASVVNNVYHNSGEMADRILKRSSRRFSSVVTDLLYQALRDAERRGRCQCGGNRINDEPRTYWLVGDYIVTYYTDDLNFNTEMLTEDMMYDLIIEEY